MPLWNNGPRVPKGTPGARALCFAIYVADRARGAGAPAVRGTVRNDRGDHTGGVPAGKSGPASSLRSARSADQRSPVLPAHGGARSGARVAGGSGRGVRAGGEIARIRGGHAVGTPAVPQDAVE